jgi:phage-related protein
MPDEPTESKRRWRFYRTASGNEPVREFLDHLSPADAEDVVVAMKVVALRGVVIARHLRGDIYEVRVTGETQSFRVLFATEGRHSQILLALVGFSKKTQRTPSREIDLADSRLADWRGRAR